MNADAEPGNLFPSNDAQESGLEFIIPYNITGQEIASTRVDKRHRNKRVEINLFPLFESWVPQPKFGILIHKLIEQFVEA